MSTTPTTLTESIDKAILTEDAKAPAAAPEVVEKVEKKEEAKPAAAEEKKEPAKADKYGLSEMEGEQAKQLFAGLKDPKQAPILLKFFADQAGVEKVETKAEAKEAKADIHAMLKEALGPEFDYLADKMGPALSKFVDEKLKESTKDIRENLLQQEQTKLEDQTARAMGHIAKEFFDADSIPDDVVSDMTKLMERIPPSADMSAKEYVEIIFNATVGAKGLTKVDSKKQTTIKNNRTDAPSRLASGRHAEPSAVDVPKSMNLQQSIQAAIDAISEK